MTRLRFWLVSGLLGMAGSAVAPLAAAQSPSAPAAYVLRRQPARSDPFDTSSASPAPNDDVFRTTLAPISSVEDLQRDSHAQDNRKDRSHKWSWTAEAVTHAPVDVGGQLMLQTPFGLRLGTGFGWIPSAYIDLVANVATNASGTNSTTGSVVRNGIDGGNVWRAQLGFRPVGGLYLDAGYALVHLKGSLNASEIAPVAGVSLAGTGLESAGYDLKSTIHAWLAEVGWETHLGDHAILGIGAGVMGTISASTEATPNFALGDTPQAKALSQNATDQIDSIVKRYGFVPTLHVRMGFDFL